MLTCQQIKELKFIIDYLNHTENPKEEDIRDKTEDLELLLSVLSSMKISKMKHIFNKPVYKTSKPVTSYYTKEDVIQLFSAFTADDIIKNYSLMQLKTMFTAVYGKNPMSKAKKEDIVNAIGGMLRQRERIEGFKELGR